MKTTDRYHKWVEWSEEDSAYVGKCPDLISGIHGDDPVEVYPKKENGRVGRAPLIEAFDVAVK